MNRRTLFLNPEAAGCLLRPGEDLLTVLFSIRGSLQRGGYAPWPLFTLRWADSRGDWTVYHNKTNQIRFPSGMVNLDGTPFRDVGVWRHYRLYMHRNRNGEVETEVLADGVPVCRGKGHPEGYSAGSGPEGEPTEPPQIRFECPRQGGILRSSAGYLLIAPGEDLRNADLEDVAREENFDPGDYPETGDLLPPPEPLPAPPEGTDYPGDLHPFVSLSQGGRGLDLRCLSSSGNRVGRDGWPPVIPPGSPRNPEERFREEDYDAVADIAAREGSGRFRTVAGALDSLPPGGGRVLILPGIYRETLLIRGGLIHLEGLDPAATVITGYEARTNGIAGNQLVRFQGDPLTGGRLTAANLAFYNRGAEWNRFIGHDEQRGAALGTENIRDGEFRNCLFLGRQDTLYLKNGSMRFFRCYVEGDVDFVCGGAAALFEECHLHCLPHDHGIIAASAPAEPADGPSLRGQGSRYAGGAVRRQPGFVFYSCLFTMEAERGKPVSLGRGPWLGGSGLPPGEKERRLSSCLFVRCRLGSREEPFLLAGPSPWKDMDRSCRGERYAGQGLLVNGRPVPAETAGPLWRGETPDFHRVRRCSE